MNVIITGAGQGLGKALALRFAGVKRVNLYLISRSAQKLAKVVNECKMINPAMKVRAIPFDLDRILREDLPEELYCRHVDILINNAGMLVRKEFSQTSAEEMMGMITTNFLAPASLINKMFSKMGGEFSTHILNIGSMGGFQGSKKFVGLSIYSASKAALASLTECLAEEFKGRNIFINCLAIGSVQTEMLETAFPGYKAPITADQMAEFIADFALKGYKFFNGKVLPVSIANP